ncbi:MAG: substrate-binding domain-containing protein, partial [Pseudomonadota bacterium]
CSRATGKLLFSRPEVEAWLVRNTTKASGSGRVASARPSVFLGSTDPLLEWALRQSECGIATFFDGSVDGLERFQSGDGIAAGLHIPDGEDWNISSVQQRIADAPVVLIEWAWRQRGFIVHPEQRDGIMGVADLSGKRVVPRQEASGSQILLEKLLADLSLIQTEDVRFIAPARSEADAAVTVLEGKADVAFGLEALAVQYRLGFVPLVRERYDVLVDRRAFFEAEFQTLLSFCRSREFSRKAKDLAGYDVSGLGRVRFNGSG